MASDLAARPVASWPRRHSRHGAPAAAAGFSKVKIITDRETKQQWACKIMSLPPADSESKEDQENRTDTLREIDAVLDLEHPNVVGMKEYFVENNRVYLIMELLRGEQGRECGAATSAPGLGELATLLLLLLLQAASCWTR